MRKSRIPLWESGFHAFLASRLLNTGDENYITNRAALNKLALAMLEHYRYWLWETGVVDTRL